MLSWSACKDAGFVASARSDRRTKRIATKPLIPTHTPKHTHKSELKVIPRRSRPESMVPAQEQVVYRFARFQGVSWADYWFRSNPQDFGGASSTKYCEPMPVPPTLARRTLVPDRSAGSKPIPVPQNCEFLFLTANPNAAKTKTPAGLHLDVADAGSPPRISVGIRPTEEGYI